MSRSLYNRILLLWLSSLLLQYSTLTAGLASISTSGLQADVPIAIVKILLCWQVHFQDDMQLTYAAQPQEGISGMTFWVKSPINQIIDQ